MIRRGLLACVLSFGCGGRSTFECQSDGECAGAEAVGRCEANGWCSFPDDGCPSLRRYGTLAGDGLAGTCVPESDGTGDASVGTSTTENPSEASTEPPTTSPVTTEGAEGPDCGNGVLDDGEECDGNDFGAQTCASLGHASGELDCDGCTIDEDTCSDCGDGMVQADEACDTKTPPMQCADFGWFAGEVACTDDCSALDESACTNCGNEVVDIGEHCDGGIGAATCSLVGFGDGKLGCGDDCLFDTAGCGPLLCGEDAIAPLGNCPRQCSSCEGGVCLFDCSGNSVCTNDEIVCPEGWPCVVRCDGSSACSNVTVSCPELYACSVDCVGSSGCSGVEVTCSLSGTCTMTCSTDASVCAGANVDCGSDRCNAPCTEGEPSIECGPSCLCEGCN